MTLVDNINLLDLDIFERGEVHEALKTLRHQAPVYWNEGNEDLKGFWCVTCYEDIKFVSTHPELFSSAKGITGPGLRNPESNPNTVAQPGGISIITMDPPRHVKIRRLVNRGFTPRAVNATEPKIRQIAVGLLERLGDRDDCDFVIDVASQLPLAVICGLMGIPEQYWPLMFQLTNQTLGAADPEYQAGVVAEEERGTVLAQTRTALEGRLKMVDYFRTLLDERRKSVGDDLVSVLLESEVDGERLDEADILAFCFLLVLAGNETTRNAISGGLWALCDHPDERARLQADMSLIDSAVEEILRWTSPLHHMARRATAEVELRGKALQPNDSVLMWYPSANRDEAVFDDPYRFDVTRSPNDHLAFGHAEHFCLGAGFAKKEIRVMFEELFARYPGIQLNGKPERLRSNFINGIKRMPVRLR
jgi:cytochrome P450